MELVLDRPNMTADEQKEEARKAIRARKYLLDFAQWVMPTYQRADHLELLARHLEAVERGEIDRLMVMMPPRHGKSLTGSVMFPAFFMARNPERSFITASYGGELASGFGRRARNALMDVRTKEIFPNSGLAQDSKAANLWHTTMGGEFVAAGIHGAITGHGAHVLNIDDPIKTHQEAASPTYRDQTWDWYRTDAYTRLEPNAAIILTLTRWHEDDLAGRLLREAEHGGDQWVVLKLPAEAEEDDLLGRPLGKPLWPKRFNKGELKRRKETLGPTQYAALYQQRPAPEEGDIFKWWPRWEVLPAPHKEVLVGIDTAYTESRQADSTAASAWVVGGDGKIRLVKAESWQAETPQAERGLRWFYESLKVEFAGVAVRPLVRKKVAIDRIMAQHLQVAGVPAIPVPMPGGDKETYARLIAPQFESEMALVPTYAPWLDKWLRQHLDFPHGLHDDFVETTNVVLYYRSCRPSWTRPTEPINLYGGYDPWSN